MVDGRQQGIHGCLGRVEVEGVNLNRYIGLIIV
jgi:hypothetical protein